MRVALAFGLLLALAVPALCHMVVEPATSAAGGPQRYTLVVPTEGDSATVRIELRLPMGMEVVALEAKPGWEAANNPFPVGAATLRWSGGRIPPGQMTTFEFLAMNPSTARTLEWNAAQWFEDGTSERWGQGAPPDHEASTTTLVAANPASAGATDYRHGPHEGDAPEGAVRDEPRGAASKPRGDAGGAAVTGAAAPATAALWIVALASLALAVAALLAALSARRAADRP